MEIDMFRALVESNSPVDKNTFAPIKDKIYIGELLKSCLKNRRGISIFIGDSRKSFKTFIQNIDTEEIITEHISFLNLYKSKFEYKNIVIVFSSDDIFYGFRTEFRRFINKDQLAVAMPDVIYKLQRRGYVRIKQSTTLPVSVAIAPHYKKDQTSFFNDFIVFWKTHKDELSISVVDISEAGISIMIKTDYKGLDDLKLPIFKFRLSLMNKSISIEARNVSILSLPKKHDKYRYRLGFSFRSISEDSQSVIKEYIVERQAEILRKQKEKRII